MIWSPIWTTAHVHWANPASVDARCRIHDPDFSDVCDEIFALASWATGRTFRVVNPRRRLVCQRRPWPRLLG